jgi:hypothetical protein
MMKPPTAMLLLAAGFASAQQACPNNQDLTHLSPNQIICLDSFPKLSRTFRNQKPVLQAQLLSNYTVGKLYPLFV